MPEHPVEAHIVRIVAFHPFRREKQGIHRSDLFCFRCNVLQIGNDSFFVRNGHIAAGKPLPVFPYKSCHLVRLPFQQGIGILAAQGPEDGCMDLGRQAMHQYPS